MVSRNIRRKFGQNYLSDPAIIFEMGQSISPQDGTNFFEIGPGMGALTKVLNRDGIFIKAIDIDQNNIEYLLKEFKGPATYEFLQGDILSFPLNFLEDKKYRIVGNLPYNISTQIILNFISWSNKVEDMHFLVQKEVAEKIDGSLGTKNWGKLSIKLAAFFHTQIYLTMKMRVMNAPPPCASATMVIVGTDCSRTSPRFINGPQASRSASMRDLSAASPSRSAGRS